MIDICTYKNLMKNIIFLVHLLQMIVQGTWVTSSCFYNIPFMNKDLVNELKFQGVLYLAQLIELDKTNRLENLLKGISKK